jgi:hypothetical protein
MKYVGMFVVGGLGGLVFVAIANRVPAIRSLLNS